MSEKGAAARPSTKILDPNPSRRKKLTEKIQKFLDGKLSLSELKGISKEKLYMLSEAGNVKFKHGRIDEAEKIFESLLLLDHRNAYIHAAMAAVHQKKGRPIEAVFEYSTALSLNPKEITSYVNRGEIYLRNRNYKKAAEDFRNAILLDMSGRNSWANRARSLVIALKRSIEADQHTARRQGKRIVVKA